jgi:replicative DNA helicase
MSEETSAKQKSSDSSGDFLASRDNANQQFGLAAANFIPPQNIEVEEAILGGILLDPEAYGRVAELLLPKAFYIPAHGHIYQAAIELHASGLPTDLLNVSNWLADNQLLEKVGGQNKLVQLVERTVSAVNVDSLAVLLMDKYLRRELIQAGNQVGQLGYDMGKPLEQVLDQAEQKVLNVTQVRPQAGLTQVGEILIQTCEDIEARHGDLTPPGLTCDFADLDAMTGGFQRSDLIIVAGRPSMGKCLAYDAEIVLADGSIVTIGSLYQQQDARLLTLQNNWQFQWTRPSNYVDDGIKPVFRVKTSLGREIETTLTHPFLTLDGWQPLSALTVGEKIAVPRIMPVFGQDSLPECAVKILGYLIGDGNLSQGTPRFTNTNPAIQQDFIDAVQEFGQGKLKVCIGTSDGTRAPSLAVYTNFKLLEQRRKSFGSNLAGLINQKNTSCQLLADHLGVSLSILYQWQKGVCAPKRKAFDRLCEYLAVPSTSLIYEGWEAICAENTLTNWLKSLGIWGKTSHDKFVPAVIFQLPKVTLAAFLNRLFATDGWATVLSSRQVQLGFATVSKKLAQQVQHLLLRFGIIARLKTRSVLYKGERSAVWQIDITDAISIQTFVTEIGICGKEQATDEVLAALEHKRYQTNRDLIPISVWNQLSTAKVSAAESWKSLAMKAEIAGHSNIHVGKRAPTGERLLKLATALDNPPLQDLAQSQVYWDEIVEIESVGSKQVYDLTIPDTHNFVANDICVHNTAISLNIAYNMALLHQLPILVFSLEMSKEQLVQRMLAGEARVDSNRLRAGRISQNEWDQIYKAVDKISELPIYIDDTANMMVMQMRSQARRLQAETGKPLGLIMLDYLQLMEGSSDNRVQEISKITRSLKGLARELNVPIIALSQLSRSVESRNNKRPMMSDLRECVAGDTLVVLADGRRVPIRELVGQKPQILAMDEMEKITVSESDQVWSVGIKPVFELKLASGRSLKATARHRIYSAQGWQELHELTIGSRVAIARYIPEPQKPIEWPEHQIILLAHLMGDGGYLKGQPLRYTTASEENSKIVTKAALPFGVQVNRHPGKGNWHQLVFSGNGDRWKPAGINLWLREIGVFDQRSHEKHIPNGIFQLPNHQVAKFIAHLWSTDGTYHVPKSERGATKISLSTCSLQLAQGVALLLLKFSIVARIRTIYYKEYRPVYTVDISGKAMQSIFLEAIGAVGCKVSDAQRFSVRLENIKANPNRDTLPIEVFQVIRDEMKEQNITTRQMSAMRKTAYGGTAHFKFAPSRAVVLDYANLLNSEELAQKASSDLFWDEVIEISAVGEEEVFDLTVPGKESWLADGIVSHNSGSIEQDADLVIMLYRDAYYNPDTPDRDITELIVTKHRNGPTGVVKLVFDPGLTKFKNLAQPR